MPRKYIRVVPGAPTKPCRRCEVVRPVEQFYVRSVALSRDGRSSYCIPCETGPERMAQKRATLQRYRQSRRAILAEAKRRPCMDCGGSFPPVCMQFDHLDPTTKRGKVSDFGSQGWGVERFLEEVAKCDLVCANCHAIRTERRRVEALERTS